MPVFWFLKIIFDNFTFRIIGSFFRRSNQRMMKLSRRVQGSFQRHNLCPMTQHHKEQADPHLRKQVDRRNHLKIQ